MEDGTNKYKSLN